MRTSPTVLPPPPSPPSSSAARAAIVVSAAATHIIHLSPPLTSSTTTTSNEPPHQIGWRHNSGTKEFEANAALVLIILLCALICALALNASIRCFLRGGGGSGGGTSGVRGRGGNNRGQVHYQHPRSITELIELQQKTNGGGGAPLESAPALVYSAGMKTKLAGVEAECVICLSEFVEGEEIRVLGWCKHGFHSQCIQEWFSSHSSCPTCRQSLRPTSPSPSSAVPDRAPVAESPTGV